MKITKFKLIVLLLILTVMPLVSFTDYETVEKGWHLADRTLAIVNNTPVISSEVDDKYDIINRKKPFPKNTLSYSKSRVLDSFINEAILLQVADAESLIVSDEKVDFYIKNNIMPFIKISTLEQFKKYIETKEKMPYTYYREELRKQILIELIMIYAVDFTPPTVNDAYNWYEVNKPKLVEVNFQHIMVNIKDDSFFAEKEAFKKIEEVNVRLKKGESFGKLAQIYSEDTMTAKNNGTSGWVTYSDLDPMLAGYLYQLKSINKIESFKSKNAYHLVKVIGKRNTPFEEIKDKILMMLAQKARMDQFNTWIQVKRVQSDVKIFMTDYQKERVFLPENKTNAPKKKNVPVKKKP